MPCHGVALASLLSLSTRLPLFQASAFAFLAPARAILSLEKWKCNNTGNCHLCLFSFKWQMTQMSYGATTEPFGMETASNEQGI